MRQYEVTFIIDPVLSNDEIKGVAKTYIDQLEKEGCKIVHVDEMGLRQLAYPIKKRTTGVYYCIEFQIESGTIIDKMELALRRDERIMRFLTVKLDRYGVKYNEDKRNGIIGKRKSAEDKEKDKEKEKEKPKPKAETAKPKPAAAATAVAESKEEE